MPYNPRNIHSPRPWRTSNVRRRRPTKGGGLWGLFFHWNFLLKSSLLIGFFLVILGGLVLAWLMALYARNLPDPNRLLARLVPVSTKIYDRAGETLLYDIHDTEKRTIVNLSDISNYAKWATISVEDKNFYNHGAFDLKGIARAIITDILHGSAAQGGSTITQQFIKNAVLTNEKTIGRKLKELILAYEMEKKFSKDEILKMYFNEIPYGSTIYGVEAASRSFFNKDAKSLDLIESAILAALPKAPTYYSPYGSHTDELEGRVRLILSIMTEQGYISKAEVTAAEKVDILKKIKTRDDNLLAPHFSLYIKDLLTEKYGRQLTEKGGLKVITTLDWSMQQIAEEEVKNGAEKNEKKYNGGNASLVAMDPKTGQVLAMVGSRGYFDKEHDGAVNVAMRPRQPGSSFKPIVYATAFSRGYTPDTVLYDVVTTFKAYPKDYEPHNYDGNEHGAVTIRQAFAGSLNIPAVKTLYLTGVENVLNQAEKMGYTTLQDRSRFGLSLVLGGAEVKLLEHTAAYASLANEGEYVPPSFILRVEDQNGRTLEEWQPPDAKRVLDQNVTRLVVNIMSDNNARAYIFGANSALYLPDRPVAAKTGTTNDWHDGWTLGFTPSLVAGVWTGNNNNDAMAKNADGVLTAGPIWHNFMTRVLKGKPVENFTPPTPVITNKSVLDGIMGGSTTVTIDKISGKLATDLTPTEMREEKTFVQPHCILYYVNKDDPQGPPPADPTTDPQFANWESAVTEWAKKQNMSSELPPTESDDIHTLANKPTVSILNPINNSNISGNTITVEVSTSSPRGVKNVKIFLDGNQMASLDGQPFNTTISLPPNLSSGPHTLTAKAYDDVLNEGEGSATINY